MHADCFAHECSGCIATSECTLLRAQDDAADDADEYGTLTVDARTLTRVFDTVVDRVLALIDAQLRGVADGCETMLVVGGFAASPFLMKRIKETFGLRVPHIWQPPQCGSAIVEGAVLYGARFCVRRAVATRATRELTRHRRAAGAGLRPELIRTRFTRKSYGVCVNAPWSRAEFGDACAKFKHEELGVMYAKDTFSTFVAAGQEVPTGKSVTLEYEPSTKAQTEVALDIYSSSGTPKFCNEPGVVHEAVVIVRVPKHKDGVQRPVICTMQFGDTEITVTAKDPKGNEYKTSVSFSKTYGGA